MEIKAYGNGFLLKQGLSLHLFSVNILPTSCDESLYPPFCCWFLLNNWTALRSNGRLNQLERSIWHHIGGYLTNVLFLYRWSIQYHMVLIKYPLTLLVLNPKYSGQTNLDTLSTFATCITDLSAAMIFTARSKRYLFSMRKHFNCLTAFVISVLLNDENVTTVKSLI